MKQVLGGVSRLADNPLDKVPGVFEQRMEKRRRMFKATGVNLSGDSNFKDLQDAFPQSVINYYSCENDDVCLAWLDTNEAAKKPPDFCPNRDLIMELLKLGE